MLLSVKERLVLANIVLPKEGNFLTLELLQNLRTALSLSEAEVAEFEAVATSEGMKWNDSKTRDVEISITDGAKMIIVEALKALDNAKKLREDYLTLYRKFMLSS